MIIVLIATILLMVGIRWVQSDPFHWKRKGIPCELPFPIFGAAATSFFKPLYKFWLDKYDSWNAMGPMVGFHFFEDPALLIMDQEIIKEICVNQAENFMSHGFHICQTDIVYGNVFHADGEDWRFTRNALTPNFTPNRIKQMASHSATHLNRYLEVLNDIADKGDPYDILDLSLTFAIDVLVNSAFGVDCDTIRNPKCSLYYKIQQEILSPTTTAKMMFSCLSPRLYDLLNISFLSRNTSEKLKHIITNIIAMRESGIGVRPDFIQGLIMTKKADEVKNKDDTGLGDNKFRFDSDKLIAQAILIFVAGTETTANTMAFLLYELANNQEIQNKMRSEICDLLAKTSDPITLDDMASLKYTNMCVKESLRKYPIFPILPRKCTRTTQVNGVTVNRGTFVMAPIFALHRDPKFYPDPERFIPERFLETTDLPYYPFGTGPRQCIGMRFANMEIIHLLINIIPKFKWHTSEKSSNSVKICPYKTALSPLGGLFLKVEKIN